MNHQKAKHKQQRRRRLHVRNKITGTSERPRLTVFRSSKHIYAQLIDDLSGVTLAAASSAGKEANGTAYGGNVKAAVAVGKKLAEAAKPYAGTTLARGAQRLTGTVAGVAVGLVISAMITGLAARAMAVAAAFFLLWLFCRSTTPGQYFFSPRALSRTKPWSWAASWPRSPSNASAWTA